MVKNAKVSTVMVSDNELDVLTWTFSVAENYKFVLSIDLISWPSVSVSVTASEILLL